MLSHARFLRGETWTRFIDDSPELFDFPRSRDRASRLLTHLTEVVVNGHPTIRKDQRRNPSGFVTPPIPKVPAGKPPEGTAQVLAREGARGLVDWIRRQEKPLLTDTTMRDAHQSLLATRVRTRDMLAIAHATAHLGAAGFAVQAEARCSVLGCTRIVLDQNPNGGTKAPRGSTVVIFYA